MADTGRGPAPHALRRPARGTVPLAHARHFHGDPTVGRRLEQATNRIVTPHSQFEEVRTQLRAVQRRLEQAQANAAEPRRHFGAGHNQPETGRPAAIERAPGRVSLLRERLEHNLLRLSAVLFMIGAAGWCLLIANQFRTPTLVAPAGAAISKADLDFVKPDPSSTSSHARIDDPGIVVPRDWASAGGESPASIVARGWSDLLEMRSERRVADRGRTAHARAHAGQASRKRSGQAGRKGSAAEREARGAARFVGQRRAGHSAAAVPHTLQCRRVDAPCRF